MRKMNLLKVGVSGLLPATAALLMLQPSARAELVYAVTSASTLVSFDSSDPGNLLSGLAITGLAPGENIMGIDVRPTAGFTGQLFALGSQSNVYMLDPATGSATLIGDGFSPALNGAQFGFDFNPTVDRIRVTSDVNQNLRLHPDTGEVVFTDTSLAYAAGDPNFGNDPSVVGSAYTNSFPGALTTTLYNIDSALDVLVTQLPPNNGTLNTVGSLGLDAGEFVGFDISGLDGTAYAAIWTPGDVFSKFYTINLATGAASIVGEIGGGLVIHAMTLPEPSMIGLVAIGALAIARRSHRRS